MRLKSLKLAGFKSFANPTTFTFTKNITAIVGPNGCGKSNVIDAIRWVLGESSAKQLRGGSMSDVIFAGANGKSARSMASVELTFEHTKDSDTGIRHALNLYQELSLRRQITSDGKSDYFINGQKVRRRDVVDVFLGTGLSARSYAVIEQGMIGRIIDADGVRLREFIEESAGVSRYQARRGETQKQLGIAKDNLERLTDLQSELAKQQKSLSEQARVADEYETLKAKLTDIETELLTHRLFDAWQTHQAHTQTADTLATQKQIFDAQMSTLQREVQTHTKQLYEIDHLKEATATAHHKKALKTQSAKHLWDKAVEDKQNATHTLDRLIDEHKLADDTDHTHTKAICTHAQAIAQIESKLSVIEEDICHHKHAKNTLDTDHHTLNKCLTELEAEHQSLTNRLAIASAGHARTQGDLEKWHVKHDKAKALLDNHSQQKGVDPTYLADLQDKIATIGEQIATLQDDIKADKPLLVNYEKHTITAQEYLANLEKTHARLASEYDTLHTLVYPSKSDKESTKLNAALTDAVALPTLGDTLTLTTLGQEYTQVLDDVLKSLLDDGIISQMGLSALECKHTVWQLAQKAVSVPQQSAPQKDAILLSQLIKEPMLSLWHQVYLLTKMPACLGEYLDEQLDTHSKAIAKLSVYDVLVSQYTKVAAFILPTGAIVHRYGILLPSTDRSDGLLTRRKAHLERLAVLEDELSSTEARIDAHTDTLSDAKRQYAEKKQENSDRTALLATKMHELSVLQAEHTKLAQEQQRKADMLTHIHHTLDGLSEEKTELDADIAQSAQLIQQTTAKLQQISPLLEEAKAKLSAHQDRQHDVKKTLSALYDDRQRLSLSLTHHQQSVTYITDAQNTAKTARINRKNTIQSQQKKLDELTTKLPTLELAYLTLKNECTILSDELSAYTQKSEQVKQSANQSQALLDECQQNLAKQNDKFAKLSADIAVALARMQDLGESLKQRDEAFDLLKQIQVFDSVGFVPSLPIKTLIEKQKKLIQCQSKLGAVNLSAKDELNELNSRLDPMTKEMADIQTSIETLQGAIDAIDQKTKGLFMATLRAVNDELNNLFSKVFGGGQASLSLSEDENLPQADKWRAGLVLMAQPKGKKNSRLAVLSGGEKTLTALSLIFAIFKQHPAPFCVLDEVDAPLDDANVERFTNLIDELACNVQFIFISHNKLAMQIADELKGVTMPVAGISSLVSVSLDEVEAMVAN